MTQCFGQTKPYQRCKKKVKGHFCPDHDPKTSPEFNDWLIKEIKRISSHPGENSWICYLDAETYLKDNKIVIWSILEEADQSQFYITFGEYPNKLKVHDIRKPYQVARWKTYCQDYHTEPKLDFLVDMVSMGLS